MNRTKGLVFGRVSNEMGFKNLRGIFGFIWVEIVGDGIMR